MVLNIQGAELVFRFRNDGKMMARQKGTVDTIVAFPYPHKLL